MSSSSPKQLVQQALTEVFVDRDVTAVDRYCSPDYLQHGVFAADGIAGFRDFAAHLPDDFAYECVRLLADGDLVVAHGIYQGLGEPMVAFDLFRVADDRLVEHWDVMTPVVTETASGHSQTDGPTEATDLDRTEANRELVEGFVQAILIDGDMSRLAGFFDGDNYVQHNPGIPDLVSGLGTALAALAEQGITMQYDRRHRTVAEGNFVFTQSEGSFGGQPHVFYDLFRVQDGFVAEHWDVMIPRPTELRHDNGLF